MQVATAHNRLIGLGPRLNLGNELELAVHVRVPRGTCHMVDVVDRGLLQTVRTYTPAPSCCCKSTGYGRDSEGLVFRGREKSSVLPGG